MVNCQLNAHYIKALSETCLGWTTRTHRVQNMWHKSGYVTLSTDGLGEVGFPHRVLVATESDLSACSRLACCGITELVFEPLQNKKHNKIEVFLWFEELIAKYIHMAAGNMDQRIVIVGIPTEVGSNSQYRLPFYTKLREVLLKFGFVEMQKTPYTNFNSKNKITVLVGQMPYLTKVPNLLPQAEENTLNLEEDF